jgi:hypothetical protein
VPPPEEDDFPDVLVYWEKTGVNQDNEPTVSQPREIECRWQDKHTQIVGRDGAMVGLEATAFVPERLKEKSIVWLGELEDRPGTAFGDESEALMEVYSVSRIPDIRGEEVRWRLNLRRYTDKRPALT